MGENPWEPESFKNVGLLDQVCRAADTLTQILESIAARWGPSERDDDLLTLITKADEWSIVLDGSPGERLSTIWDNSDHLAPVFERGFLIFGRTFDTACHAAVWAGRAVLSAAHEVAGGNVGTGHDLDDERGLSAVVWSSINGIDSVVSTVADNMTEVRVWANSLPRSEFGRLRFGVKREIRRWRQSGLLASEEIERPPRGYTSFDDFDRKHELARGTSRQWRDRASERMGKNPVKEVARQKGNGRWQREADLDQLRIHHRPD